MAGAAGAIAKPRKRTKSVKPAAVARKKPGPAPKAPEERVLKKTVSLRPETYAGLYKIGGGNLSKGVETVYATRPAASGKKSG